MSGVSYKKTELITQKSPANITSEQQQSKSPQVVQPSKEEKTGNTQIQNKAPQDETGSKSAPLDGVAADLFS